MYKVSCKTKKLLNFSLRISSFSNFRLELPWKDYYHVWCQHAHILETAKFREKKPIKGLDRNCLIWVFLSGVWNKSFSYLKLTPWSFAKCKVLCKLIFSNASREIGQFKIYPSILCTSNLSNRVKKLNIENNLVFTIA